MTIEERAALGTELDRALARLEGALREAASAASELRQLAPRVTTIDTLVQHIESALSNGRSATTAPSAPPRPTLVLRDHAAPAMAELASDSAPIADASPPAVEQRLAAIAPQSDAARLRPQMPHLQSADNEALSSFRLEFESHPGPLDLRAVDEAVSEHPAVRDVALLDYDGRKATLKVWITASARPTDVQDALRERTSQLFPADAVVKVLALNGVA